MGAGMSGLYAGLILQEKGIPFHIFESQNRVGGRIWTYRFTSDDDQFFEAGAMRIPYSQRHGIVYELIKRLNDRVSSDLQIETIPYVLNCSGNRVFVNASRTPEGRSICLADADSGFLSSESLGFNLPEPYNGQTAQDLLLSVLNPFLTDLKANFTVGFQKLLRFDDMSFRAYLGSVAKWPQSVIDFVETLCSQTNQFSLSFAEIVLQHADFSTADWHTIKNGMDRLPQAMASILGEENISVNTYVSGISYSLSGVPSLTVRHKEEVRTFSFQSIILAIPPASIRAIPIRPRWSPLKEIAIRSIHVEPLYKIGLRFKTRFWEDALRVKTPCFGGQSVTDLPSRWVVYPSNGIGSKGPGVLILYSWMSDALAHANLTADQRVRLALSDITRLYEGEVDVHEEFMEAKDICWAEQWAGGDTMYLPGQYSALHDALVSPERKVYFAGEHASFQHTWISGALESSAKAVQSILQDRLMLYMTENPITLRIEPKAASVSEACFDPTSR